MAGATDCRGISVGTAPIYLICDNDGVYGQIFTARLRAIGIQDRPISPKSPWQNAYVERLIGTLRRDCLDHVLIFGEPNLRRVLTAYSIYYNEMRTHLGLSKDAPLPPGCPAIWAYNHGGNPTRIAPSLRADMIFGNDRGQRKAPGF
jgi:Integrase core domain